jgi:phospholipase C
MPSGANSQHNGWSMATGDNWIGKVVGAIMNGPQWQSTAIFITYDDCGCFYDHVAPPAGDGPRVPMVIVSPYAKPGYTDSTPATSASMLAFVEHVFGLPALGGADATSYDFAGAFSFGASPPPTLTWMRGVPVPSMETTRIPPHEQRFLRQHRPGHSDT